MNNRAPHNDITRATLAVLAIGALIVAAYWVVKPFLLAALWASIIVVATWPLLIGLENRLKGRRNIAAAIMTTLLAFLFILPLIAAASAMVVYADRILDWVDLLSTIKVPLPPSWVDALPAIGPKLSEMWRDVAMNGATGLSARMTPHAEAIASWFLSQAGNPVKVLFDFLVTVIISGILYGRGDAAAEGALRFARRLAGDRGEETAALAGKAVRGVVLGVALTAVVQSFAAGLGLAVAGVPAAAMLTALMLILCLAQLGPSLVLVPAVIWLFWSGSTGWGIFLSVWSLLVTPIDNFLRPVLIRKSVDIPAFLVLPGVIGGLITIGIVGVFIGPVILVVAYSLFMAWIKEGEEKER